jgi:hypothetical protein
MVTITRNNELLVLVEMYSEMGTFRLRRKTLQWSDRRPVTVDGEDQSGVLGLDLVPKLKFCLD